MPRGRRKIPAKVVALQILANGDEDSKLVNGWKLLETVWEPVDLKVSGTNYLLASWKLTMLSTMSLDHWNHGRRS